MAKRIIFVLDNKSDKQTKKQRTVTSVFYGNGPKFSRSTRLHLKCPYSVHKFRIIWGLGTSHKYIHKQAGDNIIPKQNVKNKIYLTGGVFS